MAGIFDKTYYPEDLKGFSVKELEQLSCEIREYLIHTLAKIGGHFAPNLGVVELTVALLHVFNPPKDRFVWDVGHQAYTYKILTGRKDEFDTIRQHEGLSGFPKITESEYDAFGTGHASTSISAALGIATARDLRGDNHAVIAVTGDGAMTGGLAFEGLNNAGISGRRLLVVLNDNEMSISPNVGAISKYFTRITANPKYTKTKEDLMNFAAKVPAVGEGLQLFAKKLDEAMKVMLLPGAFFEALGFRYYGPLPGHDIGELVSTFRNLKDVDRPVLVHVLTKKGKGYPHAEEKPHIYHGLGPFDVEKGKSEEKGASPSFSEVFGNSVTHFANKNRKIVAITAAMAEGTGLDVFRTTFPDRFFDVGIAEGHAVTFAAGMATRGLRPVVAIYSTFLQRAFDQVIHDVALQKLPVVFGLDRAGLVGADGPTHHGSFDISYLNMIPNMVVSAPRDGNELYDLVGTALEQKELPFAIRYRRGNTCKVEYGRKFNFMEIGRWIPLAEGEDVALLAIGSMVDPAIEAAEELRSSGINPLVVNCVYSKPMDFRMMDGFRNRFRLIVTIEENAITGGFGQSVMNYLHRENCGDMKILNLGIPDRFIDHGSTTLLLDQISLSKKKIVSAVMSSLKIKQQEKHVKYSG